jgi:hypothetical protein
LADSSDLRVGETISVTTSADDVTSTSAGSADVTLVALKASDKVVQDDETEKPEQPDERFVCMQLKIKNTGSTDLDLYPFEDARWNGDDGQTESIEPAFFVDCSSMGLTADDILSTDDPHPGQFVQGTDSLTVPKKSGEIQFSDRNDKPLFSVRVSASQ